MPTARALLEASQQCLTAAGVPSARVDSELLLAHVARCPRVLVRGLGELPEHQVEAFTALVEQRAARVPLQHLTGTAPFRHLELLVGPGVFVPRPETELLVDAVHDHLRVARPAAAHPAPHAVDAPAPIIVDLCTGSGALALALATEVPGSRVHGVEVDQDAAAWAQRNVEQHAAELAARGSTLTLHVSDATIAAGPDGPLGTLVDRVEVVVTNPPYVPDAATPRDPEVRDHDPALALYGGLDGLDVVRRLVSQAARLLRPGGLLVVEHADVQGEEAGDAGVPGLLRADADWSDVTDHLDLTGAPRYTTAWRAGARRPARAGRPMTLRLSTTDPVERARGLAAAVAALRRGQIIGLPADTQYGLASDAFSERGVAALRAAKGRADLPVPVLVPRIATVSGIARPSAPALALMRDFWPGALTLVLAAQPTLAWSLTDAAGRIAVRQPLHPVALELLDRVGPLAVVAATPPATEVESGYPEELAGQLAVLLDAGELPAGPPSTVVDLTVDPPVLVRAGAVDAADLRGVCPDLVDDRAP